MKVILGDNQFFGINHFDLEKGFRLNPSFQIWKASSLLFAIRWIWAWMAL